jgi:hypothetical protein
VSSLHKSLFNGMKISTGLLLFLFAVLRLSGAESRFYLGTYTDQPGSKGIYEGSLDSETGKLGPIMLAAAATDPSFLALSPKGDDLYAALEQWNKAGVAAFRRADAAEFEGNGRSRDLFRFGRAGRERGFRGQL